MTILEWYQKTYDSLIEKRRKFPLTKDKNDPNYTYCETHHILPKCMGGSNDEENLVNLTAREHFIAHMLLVKIYEKNGNKNGYIKMCFALRALQNIDNNCNRSKNLFDSKLYSKLIENARHFTEEHKKNIAKSRRGYKYSEEKKKEMRENYKYKKERGLIKPKVPWNKGIPLAEETKRKMKATVAICNKNRGKTKSLEAKIHEIQTRLQNKYKNVDFSFFDFYSYANIPRQATDKNGKYLRRVFLEHFLLTQISKEEIDKITNEYNITHPNGNKNLQRSLDAKIKQAKTRLKNLYPHLDFSLFNFKAYCSIESKRERHIYFLKYRNSL